MEKTGNAVSIMTEVVEVLEVGVAISNFEEVTMSYGSGWESIKSTTWRRCIQTVKSCWEGRSRQLMTTHVVYFPWMNRFTGSMVDPDVKSTHFHVTLKGRPCIIHGLDWADTEHDLSRLETGR
jgi:hypothetical protein